MSPTSAASAIQGTRSTGPVPFGLGGTDPTSVLLVPDGDRPSATTLVPAEIASPADGGAVTDRVPVESTRARNTGWLPTRTVTVDRPRNPTPPTWRPLPCGVTAALGTTTPVPRPPDPAGTAMSPGVVVDVVVDVAAELLVAATVGCGLPLTVVLEASGAGAAEVAPVVGAAVDAVVGALVGAAVVAGVDAGVGVAVPVQLTESLSAAPP